MICTYHKVCYALLIPLLLVESFHPVAQTDKLDNGKQSEMDAYLLMMTAHSILGNEYEEAALPGYTHVMAVPSRSNGGPGTSPLEQRLAYVDSICAESRQSIEARFTGLDQCERLAISELVCQREINALETALNRSRRGRGMQTFLRRSIRRLDPSRANLGKLLGFIRHEVLPEAAQTIVTSALSGGNVVARRIIRQTFLRKARQVVKANLTTDLMMSGVPPETIREIGLPVKPDADAFQITVGRDINLEAIRGKCEEEAKTGQSSEPEAQGEQSLTGMLEGLQGLSTIQLTCQPLTFYAGTNFIDDGAPEHHDLQVEINVKTAQVAYKYEYTAQWQDYGYIEAIHRGTGDGLFAENGWFLGDEQYESETNQYILNIETGEKSYSEPRQGTDVYPFIGAVMDDLSQAVYCRNLITQGSPEELIAKGKEFLLTRLECCVPCKIETK